MRVAVPAWVVWACFTFGMLCAFSWIVVVYPPSDHSLVPFVGTLIGAMAGIWITINVAIERTKYTIGETLEQRLERVRETRWEVEGLLADPLRFEGGGILRDSPHATAIKARIRELETAEELIKVEMTYEALGKLDKKAAKVIRKELK